ncbi:MAG: triacylglycerol lipase [Lachnospiraceae bacterium]|nr:triacylglycerol lipase [Lachnospiraceae bacterium]
MARLRWCRIGCIILMLFCVTVIPAGLYLILGFCGFFAELGSVLDNTTYWLLKLLGVLLIENIIFWTGMLLVYATSKQLGVRWRVLGLVCGLIPIAHLVMLYVILKTAWLEVNTETARIKRNRKRHDAQICKTKYPLLLVHGVFFRDFEHLNYWGRVPEELEENGATLYYGNHNSASAVDESAKELEQRILAIVQETGCEKLNVIAHSKGGLDMRTALAKTSVAPYIASLTTVNTPHRGCEFADYLLGKVPQKQKETVAAAYNAGAAALGDVNPDFLAAVYDLTSENCAKRNEEVKDVPGVYYQSVGSKLNKPASGRFPLNLTYYLVKYFDGANDGLVGEKSFPWGERYQFLQVPGKRGISHGDLIDLNRENFPGFDVREFYVQLVADLKNRGF